MVRQYGCNTSNSNSTAPTVTYQKNSFVYINGMNGGAGNTSGTGAVTTSVGSCSQSFPSLIPITGIPSPLASPTNVIGGSIASGGLGLMHATLPRTSAMSSASDAGRLAAQTAALGPGGSSSSYRGHIVRLNSIDPNTVMFSTKDYPILNDVTVPEIIDELEKQFEDKLCDLQGVRLVANNVYICLSRKESLQHLTTYGFYVRGVPVKVIEFRKPSKLQSRFKSMHSIFRWSISPTTLWWYV